MSDIAHIKARPAAGSLQSTRQSVKPSSTMDYMYLACSAGTVMDITLEFTLNMFGPLSIVSTTGAGMTAGLVYQHSLGTGAWTPVGARYGGA